MIEVKPIKTDLLNVRVMSVLEAAAEMVRTSNEKIDSEVIKAAEQLLNDMYSRNDN